VGDAEGADEPASGACEVHLAQSFHSCRGGRHLGWLREPASIRPEPPRQSLFIMFFVPGTARLAPEAEQIVRQAAGAALQRKGSKIEIGVPGDAPGGMALEQNRMTAIQNILSAAHVEQKFLAPAVVLAPVPGNADAANRAEVRLLPIS
jgi:hypothetical protein